MMMCPPLFCGRSEHLVYPGFEFKTSRLRKLCIILGERSVNKSGTYSPFSTFELSVSWGPNGFIGSKSIIGIYSRSGTHQKRC